jgi:hypothetical protein
LAISLETTGTYKLVTMDSTYDVDWMAITIGVNRLPNMFSGATIVELCGYRPPASDSIEYHDWICLISKPFLLSIPPVPNIKSTIVESLYDDCHLIVRESNHSTTTIMGRQYVALDTVIAILEDARIPSVRMIQYGMKTYWRTFVGKDRFHQLLTLKHFMLISIAFFGRSRSPLSKPHVCLQQLL